MVYRSYERDLHSALKVDTIGQSSGSSVQFMLMKLQYGKNDVGYSLHANPSGYSTAGLQTTDYLNYLGFHRQGCAFFGREAYCIAAPEGFQIGDFGPAFQKSFALMQRAEKHLEACGFILDQPEGWGYFFGKPSGTRLNSSHGYGGGDGHTSPQSKQLKRSEDEFFQFAMTFITGRSRGDNGWVIHYRPKHPPLSAEVHAAMEFLGLRTFGQCPEFDFEKCLWRLIRIEEREDDPLGGNAGFAHAGFDAHPEHFSPAIQSLLEAQVLVKPFGFGFLSTGPEGSQPVRVVRPQSRLVKAKVESGERQYEYDVAFSFAGMERQYAQRLAEIVKDAGFSAFYDDLYPEQLWGKNLVDLFDDIYRKKSRYCVIFISAEYCERMWPNHERQSAQARMLEERGKEYILPVKVDDSELPGMAPTIGYLSLRQYGIERIGELLVKKLQGS